MSALPRIDQTRFYPSRRDVLRPLPHVPKNWIDPGAQNRSQKVESQDEHALESSKCCDETEQRDHGRLRNRQPENTESRSPKIANGVAAPKSEASSSMTTVLTKPATAPASNPAPMA